MKVLVVSSSLWENSYAVIEVFRELIKALKVSGGAEHAIWQAGTFRQAITSLFSMKVSDRRSGVRP